MHLDMAPIIIFFITIVESLYIPNETQLTVNPTIKNPTPEEIQHAVCKISSKDLEATANATIFRELKGVCTSTELQTYINRTEFKILEEIEIIKNILKENGFKIFKEKIAKQSEALQIDSTKNTLLNITHNNYEIFSNQISSKRNIKSNDFKSIETNNKRRVYDQLLTRNEEILKYNNTIKKSKDGNIFIYYWNISRITDLLLKKEIYISSPEFYVLGHSLHLQFYPNYIENESFTIYLGVSTKGFIKKHKIYILNHFDSNEDIDSGLIHGFKGKENMFTVLIGIIAKSGFILKDCMLIKLEILINS